MIRFLELISVRIPNYQEKVCLAQCFSVCQDYVTHFKLVAPCLVRSVAPVGLMNDGTRIRKSCLIQIGLNSVLIIAVNLKYTVKLILVGNFVHVIYLFDAELKTFSACVQYNWLRLFSSQHRQKGMQYKTTFSVTNTARLHSRTPD